MILETLFELRRLPRLLPEFRSGWGPGRHPSEHAAWWGTPESATGLRVDDWTALSNTPLFAGINLIAGTLSCLTFQVDSRQEDGKFDRDEEQWCAQNAVGVLRLTPFEHADGCEKSVGAVFLESETGRAVKFSDTAGMLGLVQRGVETILREFVFEEGSEPIGLLLFGIDGWVARIVFAHQLWLWLNGEFCRGG